jgi:TonB family protein
MPQPVYPPELAARRTSARVVVGFVLGADGTPIASTLTVLEHAHDARFEWEAMRVVRAAKFWPACHKGRTVRVRAAVPVEFRAR